MAPNGGGKKQENDVGAARAFGHFHLKERATCGHPRYAIVPRSDIGPLYTTEPHHEEASGDLRGAGKTK